MEDLFRKFLYTGVGLVSLTADRLQALVSDLVENKTLSEDEGKKIVDDFLNDTTAKREEFEARLREIVENVVKNFNVDFFKKDEANVLRDRIAALEAKLGEVSNDVTDSVAEAAEAASEELDAAAKELKS